MAKTWKYLSIPVVIIFFAALHGCGYHFAGGGENIDKAVQTVFIEPVINGTSEANIEKHFRVAFIDQFIRGGRFKLMDNRTAADAVFKVNIKMLTTAPLSRTISSLAAEERLTVTLELVFETKEDKKAIWVNKNFSGTGDYIVDNSNANATEARRKTALTKLANDTADRAYSMMMSGF